jgi:hypothetical protein
VFGSIARKWHSPMSTESTGPQSVSSSFQSGSRRSRPHVLEHNSPSLLGEQYPRAPYSSRSLAPRRELREQHYRHCSVVCRSSIDRHSDHPGREMLQGHSVSRTHRILVSWGSARVWARVRVASSLVQAHIYRASPARGTLEDQGQAS